MGGVREGPGGAPLACSRKLLVSLFSLFLLQLPPMFAGAAMAMSSVSVVCSSLLLRLYRPPPHPSTRAPEHGSTRAL